MATLGPFELANEEVLAVLGNGRAEAGYFLISAGVYFFLSSALLETAGRSFRALLRPPRPSHG